jgi:hypothetical protein
MSADAGRGKKQKKRIKQGVESGQLTEKEADRLKKSQHKIHDNKQEYIENGELSKKEKSKLAKQRDRASDNIYKQKHDKHTEE